MTTLAEINDKLDDINRDIHSRGFSGVGSWPPTIFTNLVDRIMLVVLGQTKEPEYSIDDDGALSFETTLSDGSFIMCEISRECNINAGIYAGPKGKILKFMSNASEHQLLEVLK